jgi:osmoprotectant transport system ATP-binding protein
MFVLRQVSKRYGEAVALAPLDLDIEAGRTSVVIGPSGCGKSTLIRLLNRLIAPSSGTIAFAGQPVTDDSAPRLRRRMGYVIQDGGLFPHLTARGNVSLLARHIGWDSSRIEARLAALCTLTHFPHSGLGRYPAELSGGQQQRVALMRALMLEPDVLLLDEPLGALDPMIRFELQTELREIFRTLGKTVVLVTHDMGEAAYFGDTLILLRDGRVVQRGTPEDLVRRPADPFVERFVTAQRGLADAIAEVGR